MLMKSAFIATLILAATLPAGADPSTALTCEPSGAQTAEPDGRVQCRTAPQPQGVLHINILVLAPDPLGDIVNGRGPEPHASAFARFAAYAAIGNSDGTQIISGQLRAFGVAQDDLRDLADRAALHAASVPRAVRTD